MTNENDYQQETKAAKKLFNRIEQNRENQLNAETKINELEAEKENYVEAVAAGDFKAIDKLNAQIEKLKLQASSLIKLINLDGAKLKEANADINATNSYNQNQHKEKLAEIENKIIVKIALELKTAHSAFKGLGARSYNQFEKMINREMSGLRYQAAENPDIDKSLQAPPPPETQYTITIPEYVVLPKPEPKPEPEKPRATVQITATVIWASKKPNEIALGKKDTATGEITWNHGAKTRQQAADKAAALHGYSYPIDRSQTKENKEANQFENLEIKTG